MFNKNMQLGGGMVSGKLNEIIGGMVGFIP